MLAATLLTDEPVKIENLPGIRDVLTMRSALEDLGATLAVGGPGELTVTTRTLRSGSPQMEICQKMRASFVLAGPLLARHGNVELPAPGGDRIGRRPVDTHIQAFRALGAEIEVRP